LLAGGIALAILVAIGGLAAVWRHVTYVPTLAARVRATVVELSGKVDGRLLEVTVSEGDTVHSGQVLAGLESAELRAALVAAEAEMALRESAFRGMEAREKLAAARVEADIAVAQAQVAIARARCPSLETDLELRRKLLPEKIRRAQAVVGIQEAELKRLQAGSRPQELEASQERIAAANALLALYELEVEQSRELVGEGIDSRYVLEVRKTRLENQRHTVRQAELELALLEAGPRPEEITAAEQALVSERAALAQVQLGEGELAKLSHEVEVSRAQLVEAGARLEQAEARRAEVAVARQQTAAAEAELGKAAAAVDGRRAALREMAIVSPVDGTVTRIFAGVGEVCPKGVPILLIRDTSRSRWIEAFVDEEDACLVHVGQEAVLRVPAGSGRQVEAVVTQIGLHTETLDSGGRGGATGPQFGQPDRVWVKLVPTGELDEDTVTGTTARGVIRVR